MPQKRPALHTPAKYISLFCASQRLNKIAPPSPLQRALSAICGNSEQTSTNERKTRLRAKRNQAPTLTSDVCLLRHPSQATRVSCAQNAINEHTRTAALRHPDRRCHKPLRQRRRRWIERACYCTLRADYRSDWGQTNRRIAHSHCVRQRFEPYSP